MLKFALGLSVTGPFLIRFMTALVPNSLRRTSTCASMNIEQVQVLLTFLLAALVVHTVTHLA